ncbi:ScpA family protein [Candidatus Endomicrobiellum devescovinae]|jgi:segregation and condensation protein A|uniref:segregation and condensation protein A n=1 Tax=Candidatus Endomicrobiellum devescovinae TaxID=3242322 RepID=UPI002832F19F|nr:segregation/condensation protein A [Endomicrobium sp.]
MTYDIHLDAFEGPLDLLLHLIKKNDLEINEIKIADITAEYLSYLDLMKELNIDVAGEFLVMASTLMQIKSKSLLPSDNGKDSEEDDPFDQLKNRLLEYQKYKEVGKLLSYKINENSQIYYRPEPVISKQDFVLDATIFDLMSSFRDALTALPDNIKEIMYQEIPIENKIREILDILEGKQYVSFTEILKLQNTRLALIVCFMAVLELVKNKQIVAKQSELFSEIRIYKVYNNEQELEQTNKDINTFEFIENGKQVEHSIKNEENLNPKLELLTETDNMIQGEEDGNI